MRDTFERIKRVSYVVKGSPAFQEGIKKGDKIIAINGRKIERYTYSELYEMFRQEGKKVKLVIERGQETLKFKLKLRRLL